VAINEHASLHHPRLQAMIDEIHALEHSGT